MYQNRIQALVGWWLTRSFGFGIDTDRYLLVDLTAEIRRMFLVGRTYWYSVHSFLSSFSSRRDFERCMAMKNLLNYHTLVVYFDVDISRRVVPHRGRIFIGKKYL